MFMQNRTTMVEAKLLSVFVMDVSDKYLLN